MEPKSSSRSNFLNDLRGCRKLTGMTLGAGEAWIEGRLSGAPQAVTTPSAQEFAELYRTHWAYVWKSARRLGVPAEEVEDVVQETFLTLHRVLHDQEPQRSLNGLLFSILLRIIQRQRRSKRRRLAVREEVALAHQAIEPIDPGPDKTAEAAESLRILEEIMDRLDPAKRVVLVLAELEGKPVVEIAEILGININTAATRLRRAREFVEASLARYEARERRRFK
ncbi:MAG: sigma-70 family RNA polymerase sigma factor [Myxococcales bacterium]|nr:sigma-70 family RNA polymerase sigma factor [Myxococcales bacterium]